MYRVYLDGNLMYCPIIPSFVLESLTLNLELNATNVCEFLIPTENPYCNRIVKRKSIIKIYDDNERIFRGVVQNTKRSFLNGLHVTCEGEMVFLRDSIQRPYQFNGSVEEFFAFLIGEHNKQVDEKRQFKVGRCTVSGLTEKMDFADEQYLDTWENLQKKLIDEFGGYLWTREEEEGVYIDYLEDFETLNEQQVEFGKNLLDFEEAVNGAKIKTAIIPLGCKMQNEEADEEYRLDIKQINNGLDYIYEEESVKKYGLIFEKVIWDDVTMPEELLQKGRKELQNYTNPTQSIEIRAVNLHNVQQDIRSFRLGNYTKVSSEPHHLDEVMLTRKLDLDLLDPASGTLYLGAERKAFVDQQIDNHLAVGGVIEKIESVEKNLNSVQNEVVHEIEQKIYREMENSEKGIISTVGKSYYKKDEVETMISDLNTKFVQNSEEFWFQFNNSTNEIHDMKKYIRFVDGKIIVGQAENAFQVQITNNHISFIENNVEVAYIADRKIYITDGDFIRSLKVGAFAFKPRKMGT